MFAVAIAVSSNVVTEFVTFSIGAYPTSIDATRALLDGDLGAVWPIAQGGDAPVRDSWGNSRALLSHRTIQSTL